MVNNNLAPEAQPWTRAMQQGHDGIRSKIETMLTNNATQQQAVIAGLRFLPERIESLAAAQPFLPIQTASTFITYNDKLNLVTPNTWIPNIQSLQFNAPPGKTNLSIMVVSTFFLRRTSIDTYDLMRIVINGTPYPTQTIGFDSTGMAVAAASLSSVSGVTVGVDFYTQSTTAISNNVDYPNHVRSFVTTVWS